MERQVKIFCVYKLDGQIGTVWCESETDYENYSRGLRDKGIPHQKVNSKYQHEALLIGKALFD